MSNSEFINVAPRERVEDALRLMRKPLDAALNAVQAREVSLRDGGIRALVTGRTEKLGSTYLVSAEVIDPVRNLTLASDTETASGQDQIWPAVRRLSNWVRETLGGSHGAASIAPTGNWKKYDAVAAGLATIHGSGLRQQASAVGRLGAASRAKHSSKTRASHPRNMVGLGAEKSARSGVEDGGPKALDSIRDRHRARAVFHSGEL